MRKGRAYWGLNQPLYKHIKKEITSLKKGKISDQLTLLCSVYVVLGICYYAYDNSLVDDYVYDALCKHLLDNYRKIPKRMTEYLVPYDALQAGTGMHLTFPHTIPDRHQCLVSVAYALTF